MSSIKQSKQFFLIDCDNFFVSCERLFNPSLRNRPVIVLSSNDACAIARSQEAKALGITMGQPYWECKKLLENNKGIALSSNFTLYADISARVMSVITQLLPDCELYSIDEAFAEYTPPSHTSSEHVHDFALYVRHMIYKQVGIPVTIGIGATKTLAKLAHIFAKKEKGHVFVITEKNREEYLQKVQVHDIWGIGYRYSKLLHSYGINTAYDFTQTSPDWVRKKTTISGLRTQQELKGIISLSLATEIEPRKSLTVSRLFGKPITTKEALLEATADYCAKAVEKLRNSGQVAQGLSLFVVTQPLREAERSYHTAHAYLPLATAYTPLISTVAQQCIERLYSPTLRYRKVGIMLYDLTHANTTQLTLAIPEQDARHEQIMNTVDTAHRKWGRDALFFAAAGTTKAWRMKQERRSPHYTTNWHELLTVE